MSAALCACLLFAQTPAPGGSGPLAAVARTLAASSRSGLLDLADCTPEALAAAQSVPESGRDAKARARLRVWAPLQGMTGLEMARATAVKADSLWPNLLVLESVQGPPSPEDVRSALPVELCSLLPALARCSVVCLRAHMENGEPLKGLRIINLVRRAAILLRAGSQDMCSLAEQADRACDEAVARAGFRIPEAACPSLDETSSLLLSQPEAGEGAWPEERRMRIRAGLVKAQAAVVAFWWRWDRLPRSLEEATGGERLVNPVSREPLSYAPSGAGSFRIWTSFADGSEASLTGGQR